MRHIIRPVIPISRASVRRILEEERPPRRASAERKAVHERMIPDHFFDPPQPNYVWHTDMTVFRVLWIRFEVATIIDGFSRTIMGLRAYRETPTTADLVALIDEAATRNTVPRFIVTDRGGQFQKVLRAAMAERGICHACGQAKTWKFNAKIERLFWSLQRWWRLSLTVPDVAAIQKRLDAYAAWHNHFRLHEALGRLTPSEAACGTCVSEPVRFVEGGEVVPRITIRRLQVGGDPRLLYPVIKVKPRHRSAA